MRKAFCFCRTTLTPLWLGLLAVFLYTHIIVIDRMLGGVTQYFSVGVDVWPDFSCIFLSRARKSKPVVRPSFACCSCCWLFSHVSSFLVSTVGGNKYEGTRSHVKPPVARVRTLYE